jgi:hypothetical protein
MKHCCKCIIIWMQMTRIQLFISQSLHLLTHYIPINFPSPTDMDCVYVKLKCHISFFNFAFSQGTSHPAKVGVTVATRTRRGAVTCSTSAVMEWCRAAISVRHPQSSIQRKSLVAVRPLGVGIERHDCGVACLVQSVKLFKKKSRKI